MSVPFKVGFCVNCGAQTWVKAPRGQLVKPLDGTQVVWLCLCDDKGFVGTRIGTLSLCKDCPVETVNSADVIENLAQGKGSGFSGNEYELSHFPNRKFELVQRFGE